MLRLPQSDRTLFVRSDYSDDAGWSKLCRLVEAPYEEDFRAYLTFVEDRALANKALDELMTLIESVGYRSFFFVADREAVQGPEYAVLVVAVHEQRGRTFRVIPSQIWAVENNLSLANMEFSTFADNADPDGVLRGFKD